LRSFDQANYPGTQMKYIFNSSLGKAMQVACGLLAAFTLAGSVPVPAAPTAYTFTVVAKTGDIISGKTLTGFNQPSFGPNSPAINAGGNVAYYATYSEGAFVGEGIFTSASLVLKNGESISGDTVDGISFVPALNDRGTVVVRGLLSQGSAILDSKILLAKAGDQIGGQTLTSFGLPAINNDGTVAFVGSSPSGSGIFTQTAVVATSGESIEGLTLTSFGPPAINDRGTVAFQSWLSGEIATAIFTPTAVLVKVGDTIGGKTLTDLSFAPALNSSGSVAFMGVFPGGTGVFTQNALLEQTGDTIGGRKLTSFGSPVLNDTGLVAFFATYPGGEGIFTQTSLIAKTGDTICGKTLIGVGQPAINSSGAVAFTALFSDRSSAVILARPAIVPAKSSVVDGH
jgi:hypothetical protein